MCFVVRLEAVPTMAEISRGVQRPAKTCKPAVWICKALRLTLRMPLNKRADDLQKEPRFCKDLCRDCTPVQMSRLLSCARTRPLTEMQSWEGALHYCLALSFKFIFAWHWDLCIIVASSECLIADLTFSNFLLQELPPYLKQLRHLALTWFKVILNVSPKTINCKYKRHLDHNWNTWTNTSNRNTAQHNRFSHKYVTVILVVSSQTTNFVRKKTV